MIEEIKRYGIYYCELIGYENIQGGARPCIVISNDICNKYSPTITAVPITTARKKPMPTHCIIHSAPLPSIALCEQIQTINKTQLTSKVGELSEEEIVLVSKCIKVQLGI